MKAEAPCYLWWPKDILADPDVAGLTLEDEGAYRRLLDWAWLDCGIHPTDAERIGRLCKIDTTTEEGLRRAEGLRQRMLTFFDECPRTGRWTNARQEEIRAKQTEDRANKSRAGKASAAARKQSGSGGSTDWQQEANSA